MDTATSSGKGQAMKKNIAIGTLISGGGTNLQAIIDGCKDGTIQARISFTGSDRPGVKGLERAKKAGIDTFVVDYAQIVSQYRSNPETIELPPDFDLEEIRSRQRLFKPETSRDRVDFFLESRAVAERQLLDRMAQHKMDILVLAGFMRVLTPYFIDRVNTVPGKFRIMNIHPALLPAFPGTDGYGDTFRYGCRIGGCTVHFVDYGEDTGPIIGQRAFTIEDDDTLEKVREKGLAQEWQLYPECINKVAQSLER